MAPLALALCTAVRDLFVARKAAYDRTVSERLQVLESSYASHTTPEAAREIAEAQRRAREWLADSSRKAA